MVVDPKAEKYLNWTPYNYVANNPIKLIDADGKEWVDSKGNQIYANGKYTEYATANQRKVGDALQRTKTGKEQFNKLITSHAKIELKINQEPVTDAEKKGRNGYALAVTTPNAETLKMEGVPFAADVKSAVIVINIDEVTRIMKDSETSPKTLNGSETIAGLSFLDVLSAIFGHEIEHTTDSNALTGAQGKDKEAGPNVVADNIVKETKELNKADESEKKK